MESILRVVAGNNGKLCQHWSIGKAVQNKLNHPSNSQRGKKKQNTKKQPREKFYFQVVRYYQGHQNTLKNGEEDFDTLLLMQKNKEVLASRATRTCNFPSACQVALPFNIRLELGISYIIVAYLCIQCMALKLYLKQNLLKFNICLCIGCVSKASVDIKDK